MKGESIFTVKSLQKYLIFYWSFNYDFHMSWPNILIFITFLKTVRELYKFLIVVLILVFLLYFLRWVILGVNVYKQLLDAFYHTKLYHAHDRFICNNCGWCCYCSCCSNNFVHILPTQRNVYNKFLLQLDTLKISVPSSKTWKARRRANSLRRYSQEFIINTLSAVW